LNSNLKILQKTIGYTFKDNNLLVLALTHRSKHSINNERLEFLGDAVLNFIVADVLFKKFNTAHEGQLTRLRSSLVKEESLARWANEFNISDYIILGQGEKKSGGFRRNSILADAIEAILGAIYTESGFDACFKVLNSWLEGRLTELSLNFEKDAKTTLQEWLQARKLELPSYEVIDLQGKPHEQTFTVKCIVDMYPEGVTANAKSRRIAEQIAANKMLMILKEEKNSDDNTK
jgi:ribonuclease-3